MTAEALDKRSLAVVAEMLNAAIGLDYESMGASALSRAVKARSRSLGLETPALYPAFLSSTPEEIKELVEEVVVPETWFFRDREPFKFLAAHAAQRLAERISPFRVLSAPCSTGEEPYSIAMSLLEAGLDPARLSVVGADISARALDAAEKGLYGPNSFRGAEPPWTPHWFEKTDETEYRRIKADVRRIVTFQQANLVPRPDAPDEPRAWNFTGRATAFDAVFCRNFLIYLDKPAKNNVAGRIREILADDGLLFVGHAEMMPALQCRFTALKKPGCFAYTNNTPETGMSAASVGPAPARKKTNRIKTPQQPVKPVPPQPSRKSTIPAAPPADSGLREKAAPDLSLSAAREKADRGALDQSRQICLELLRQGNHTPGVYHLLGTIHEAEGNDDAAREHFGKALYLDPAHRDSLYSMALQAERSGNSAASARFRERLRRAVQRSGQA